MKGKRNEDLDYYELLEIPKDATQTEIKKAYKKQALKWHPDKNPDNKTEAEERFKQISEAYEILCDKEKRRQYDRFGKDHMCGNNVQSHGNRDFGHKYKFDNSHFSHSENFHFRDPRDIFTEFFGGTDPFSDIFDLHSQMMNLTMRHSFPGDFGFRRSQNFNNFSNFKSHFGEFGGIHDIDEGFHDHGSSSSSYSSSSSEEDEDVFNFRDTLIDGLNFCDKMHEEMWNSGFTFRSSSRLGGLQPGTKVKQSSTSTTYRNGKKIVTKIVVENGSENITIEEDGVITSLRINGRERLERVP